MLQFRAAFYVVSGVLLLGAPAMAADYDTGMRGSFPMQCCDQVPEDPLSFEVGLRYFYSRGKQEMTTSGGGSYSVEDTSHIAELYARIDDASTSSYLDATGGLAVAIDSNYSTPATSGTVNSTLGRVGYFTSDLGYLPWGNDTFKVGGLIGYEYKNESPDMGRTNYLTSDGGGDSDANSLEMHGLRLGLAAESRFNDMVDIRAKAAAVPYAWLTGTYGSYVGSYSAGDEQGSSGSVDGHLYGAETELTASVHASDNLAVQFGGRLSYLTGSGTISSEGGETATPANRQGVIENITSISFLRYGVFMGLAGTF